MCNNFHSFRTLTSIIWIKFCLGDDGNTPVFPLFVACLAPFVPLLPHRMSLPEILPTLFCPNEPQSMPLILRDSAAQRRLKRQKKDPHKEFRFFRLNFLLIILRFKLTPISAEGVRYDCQLSSLSKIICMILWAIF